MEIWAEMLAEMFSSFDYPKLGSIQQGLAKVYKCRALICEILFSFDQRLRRYDTDEKEWKIFIKVVERANYN